MYLNMLKKAIIEYCDKNEYVYMEINNIWSISIIYNLFINDIEYENNHNSNDIECYYDIIYNNIKKNYYTVTKLCEQAIVCNNAYEHIILNILGAKYGNGEGVIQNYQKAHELFEKASNKNNSTATNNIGVLYFNGWGVKKNYDVAIKLFTTAFQDNNIHATIALADAFYYGKGVKQDYTRAIELYKKAIKKNKNNYKSRALCNLGNMYKNGNGTPINYDLAAKHYATYCHAKNKDIIAYINLKYRDIFWKIYLHRWWPNKENINKKIIILLLISKYKKFSKYQYIDYFVKGICMIVIKYVAIFEKIEK